jgi:hypothetical protein
MEFVGEVAFALNLTLLFFLFIVLLELNFPN